MPRGPRGEIRPSNDFACAVKVMQIGTGEIEDTFDTPAQHGAREMGKKGGTERAKRLSPERRREIAKQGAAKRWGTQL